MAEESALTLNELNAALPVIMELASATNSEIGGATEELEIRHHITLEPFPSAGGGDHLVWVHDGPSPTAPFARILKRLLSDDHIDRSCPYCGHELPRAVRSAQEPRPKHNWTMFGRKSLSAPVGVAIVGWLHWCGSCQKDARFLHFDMSLQPNAWLRTRRPENTDEMITTSADADLHLNNEALSRLIDVSSNIDSIETVARIAAMPASGHVQRRYPWLNSALTRFANVEIIQPGGQSEYVNVREGCPVRLLVRRQ